MRLGDLVVDTTPLRTSRDFRVLFLARLVSLFGFGLTVVAIPVQVYNLTGSSLHTAAVGLVVVVPMLVGTLAGGVLADRMDRRKLIILARGSAVLVFLALAVNATAVGGHLWVIYVCAAANSVCNGISATALMAATPAVVGRDQLPAAGALMAITAELGAIFGPAVGGALTATLGLAANYTLTAAATLVTTVLVSLIAAQPAGEVDRHEPPVRAMVEGLRFVTRNRVVGGLLVIDMCVALFTVPFVLFPEIAERVFSAGPALVGYFFSAPAVGAMIAAVTSGWTGRVRHTGWWLVAATAGCGVAVAVFGLSGGVVWVAMAGLALLGASDTISEILRRSLLQHHTPDRLQGRVSSLWLAQVNVGPALGGFEAGLMARALGPMAAIVAGGVLCAASTAGVAAAMPGLRRSRLGDPSADELEEAAANGVAVNPTAASVTPAGRGDRS